MPNVEESTQVDGSLRLDSALRRLVPQHHWESLYQLGRRNDL